MCTEHFVKLLYIHSFHCDIILAFNWYVMVELLSVLDVTVLLTVLLINLYLNSRIFTSQIKSHSSVGKNQIANILP